MPPPLLCFLMISRDKWCLYESSSALSPSLADPICPLCVGFGTVLFGHGARLSSVVWDSTGSVTEGQLQVEAFKTWSACARSRTNLDGIWGCLHVTGLSARLTAGFPLLAVFQEWGVSLWFSLCFCLGVRLRGEHPDATSLCFRSFQQRKDFTAYLIQSLWASVEKCIENNFESVSVT